MRNTLYKVGAGHKSRRIISIVVMQDQNIHRSYITPRNITVEHMLPKTVIFFENISAAAVATQLVLDESHIFSGISTNFESCIQKENVNRVRRKFKEC